MTLVGDSRTFEGSPPGATQRFFRATQPLVYFFDLFYDDAVIAHLVHETNRYTCQRFYTYLQKTNGKEGWYDTCLEEMRA